MSSSPPCHTVPPALSPAGGAVVSPSRLFRSFWLAGYEGADHLNGAGLALSMNETTEHWQRLAADYALLADFGIRTVRESIGWRVADLQGPSALQRLRRHAQLADEHGIDVIWTLMHYGWPDDLDLLAPAFVERFGVFAQQVAHTLRAVSSGPRCYQPVNEISFLTWALSTTGMMRHRYGGARLSDGHAVKTQLVRAALRACDVIGAVDPAARFMHSDPVIDVVPALDADSQQVARARQAGELAYEAWDMLCGRTEPQLGGTPRHLGVVGVNYYPDNHWEFGSGQRLHWLDHSARLQPFCEMASRVWARYAAPLLIAETSHVGGYRTAWLDHMADQISLCRAQGVPIEGVCLYPIVDRHDWADLQHWHHSGLWDVPDPSPDGLGGSLDRALYQPYAQRLRHWQQQLPSGLAFTAPVTTCATSATSPATSPVRLNQQLRSS